MTSQFDSSFDSFLATYSGVYDSVEARENFTPPFGNHVVRVVSFDLKPSDKMSWYYKMDGVTHKSPALQPSLKVEMQPDPGKPNDKPPSWFVRTRTIPLDPKAIPAGAKEQVEGALSTFKGMLKAMLGPDFTGTLAVDLTKLKARLADESNPIWVIDRVQDDSYQKDGKVVQSHKETILPYA